MMQKYKASSSRLLEPFPETEVDNNRNEQAVMEKRNLQEEIHFEVSKEETSSTFQNLLSYQSYVSQFCSSEDEDASESIEDPVIIKEGTPYNDSGRHLLSSAVPSNDTICHFSLPSTSDFNSELMPGITHPPHQGSEEQVVPNISSTAGRNSSEFSPTGSRAKMLVNLFLQEMSPWSEPPPIVSARSESDFDENVFVELKGNSNENRCWGNSRASLKHLRTYSEPAYAKTRREFEVRKKHSRASTICVGCLNKEKRFQGIASLDDTTRQLLEIDIVKPLSMFQLTSGE